MPRLALRVGVAVTAASALLAPRAFAQQNLPFKLIASDAASSDQLGVAASISGNRVLVGAYRASPGGIAAAGAAYVFRRNTDGTWVEEAKLTAPDAAFLDEFGNAVALSGYVALVGAEDADDGGIDGAGAAYVFRGSPDGTWMFEAKLTSPNPRQSGRFGSSVVLEGNLAFVGAMWEYPSGAVYVFRRGEKGDWVHEAAIAPTPFSFEFGAAIDVFGDVALIGAPRESNAGGQEAGAAYVFRRGLDGTWKEEAKLLASDASPDDGFGDAVALAGGVALIGAPWDDPMGGNFDGSAYVFERAPDGMWTQRAKLRPNDPVLNDFFGGSVALAGGVALVGARQGGATDVGSAYAFGLKPDGEWGQLVKLSAPDAVALDYFGQSITLSGTVVVIGAFGDDHSAGSDAGSAYVFDVCGVLLSSISGDCDRNGVPDHFDILQNPTRDCNGNLTLDSCEIELNAIDGRFPTLLGENQTGADPFYFTGPPDAFSSGLANRRLTYSLRDFGAPLGIAVIDGAGPDFSVYEAGVDPAEFDLVWVTVSVDAFTFSAPLTPLPLVRIPGDEAHLDDSLGRSFDLAEAGLAEARFIRIQGIGPPPPGGTSGFDLDAIGLVYWRSDVDLDGDGILDECESTEPLCAGDLDGDGDADTTDLNILLSDFGCSNP